MRSLVLPHRLRGRPQPNRRQRRDIRLNPAPASLSRIDLLGARRRPFAFADDLPHSRDQCARHERLGQAYSRMLMV
jgi:hypothetical protein